MRTLPALLAMIVPILSPGPLKALEPVKETPTPTPEAMQIRQLLPPKIGTSTCLTGSYSGQRIEIEDWGKPEMEPVPGSFQFGKQVMRAKPKTIPDQEVVSLTLQLTYDDRTADYDWIYNFALMATMKDGRRTFFSAGECPWFTMDRVYPDGERFPANGARLGCYIDCDGGGMGLERVAGERAMELHFSGSGTGLRMSLGCSESTDDFRLGTNDKDETVKFRLEPAKASACKPLVKWLKNQ